MNINSSYTGLNPVSDLQSTSLERIGSSQAINSASDDASGLAIADALGLQKSSLTQTIENMSSGIAMGSIAQSGLASQKEILENIKTETLKAMNGTTSQEGKDAIEQQISKYIEQYEQVANSTTYNGETLLKTHGDISDELSIVGDETIIDMEKSDTTSISDKLKAFMSDFANNGASILETVDAGLNQLSEYQSDFGSAVNAMESNARNAISTEKEMASAMSTILEIDYSKEITDFSKSNIMAQIGMIATTQANAVQSRNISLLS